MERSTILDRLAWIRHNSNNFELVKPEERKSGEPSTHYGEWRKAPLDGDPEDNPSKYYVRAPEYLEGSDYAGCSVTLSNFDELVDLETEEGKGYILEVCGGHGTYGALVRLDSPDATFEILQGLADYPCINDEAVSEVENEWREEAMADLITDTLKIIMEDIPGGSEKVTDAQEVALSEAIREFCEGSNDLEWHYENANAYCDPKKAAKLAIKEEGVTTVLDNIVECISPVSEAGDVRVRIQSADDPPAFIDEWHTSETDSDFLIDWCCRYYGPAVTVLIWEPSLVN